MPQNADATASGLGRAMISQRRFSDYYLFRLLKESPLGKTYRAGRAQTRAIDRVVLLHLFDRDATSSAELWERIHHRGPIQQILDDPLFGRGVELGMSAGTPFAAYDYQVGRPLDDILNRARQRRMPLSIDQALAIVDQVATALVEAQKHSFEGSPILHGALSPELIQVSHRGEVKTYGFDTAPGLRGLDPNSKYRSPEIRSGAAAAAADDVFALAAILFEAVTGSAPVRNLPFEDQVSQALPSGEVSPLAPDLQELLKHGLAKRDMRTPDVVRWRHELRNVIAGDAGCANAFQLSFFLHALFREELASESQEMHEEKAARWSLVVESDETVPAAEALVVPTESDHLETTSEPVGEGEGEGEGTGEEQESEAETLDSEAPPAAAAARPKQEKRTPAYFLLGLAASLAVATVATVAFFWIGTTRLGGVATTATGTAVAGHIDPSNARALVTARAALLEQHLRAEYEPRLAMLREQLVTAHRQSTRRPPAFESGPAESPPAGGVAAVRPSPEPEPVGTGSVVAAALEPAAPPPAPTTLENDTRGGSAEDAVAAVTRPPSPTPKPEPLGSSTDMEPAAMPLLDIATDATASVDAPPSPLPAATAAGDSTGSDESLSTPPRVVQQPRPRYPRVAQRLGRSATVRLRVLVDEAGKPVETEILSDPIGLGFEREAQRAVMASRWDAATRDGSKVADWVVLQVEFQP